ncbi:MAG: antibiotic biosynthesis monooxygenase [Anaerolineae bacterium]|nr:antibiotic biosynthesis monooxygenase [Anaerolineae bacterium]
MFVALVHIHIKAEYIDPFIAATLENARNSIQEPGIAQFDFIQQADDPTRFVLIEAYRSDDAPARHRETAHYLKWRDTVVDMMAEPRTGIRYQYLLRTSPE